MPRSIEAPRAFSACLLIRSHALGPRLGNCGNANEGRKRWGDGWPSRTAVRRPLLLFPGAHSGCPRCRRSTGTGGRCGRLLLHLHWCKHLRVGNFCLPEAPAPGRNLREHVTRHVQVTLAINPRRNPDSGPGSAAAARAYRCSSRPVRYDVRVRPAALPRVPDHS